MRSGCARAELQVTVRSGGLSEGVVRNEVGEQMQRNEEGEQMQQNEEDLSEG